jgi:hypothetical protein
MDWWSEYFSRQIAILLKAVEAVSTHFSIALVVGFTLLPAVPERPPFFASSPSPVVAAATPADKPASPPAEASAPAASAPVDVVRTKPVPITDAQPLAGPVAMAPSFRPALPDTEEAADESASVHLARRMRGRERKQAALEEQSGDLGKAPKQETKTPVTTAKSKTDTAKAEPLPEPDVWTDTEIIAALKDCVRKLAPLGVEVDIAPAVKQEQCGAPAPVLLKRIGSGKNQVELQPAPMLNCAMVAGLHRWIEDIVQPAAQDILGSRIARLRNVSGYACRNRNGTRNHGDRLSEHALANAIDIGSFVTADNRTVDVKRDWGPTARDIRRKAIEVAEAKIADAQKEREKFEAEVKREREKLEKARSDLPPLKKDKVGRQERMKAQAALKEQTASLRKLEAALRDADAAEEREVERREMLERGPLKSAQMSRLGRGRDAERPIPVTGAGAKDDVRLPSESTFLRALHKGACGPFGTVLGPEANEAHRDHFHLDMAPRKRSAFCE